MLLGCGGEISSGQLIAHLANAKPRGGLTGLTNPWDQPQISANVRVTPEAAGLLDRAIESKSGDRADTWYLEEPAADGFVLGPPGQPFIQNVQIAAQCHAQGQQRFDVLSEIDIGTFPEASDLVASILAEHGCRVRSLQPATVEPEHGTHAPLRTHSKTQEPLTHDQCRAETLTCERFHANLRDRIASDPCYVR
jgi:hypothetical protein